MPGTGAREGEWVSVAEAARRVGVTPAAISYYIRKERLEHKKAGTRSVLVPMNKVTELFADSRRRSRSQSPQATGSPAGGAGELAALRAELNAVREHLTDVQAERDRLLSLLEARKAAG